MDLYGGNNNSGWSQNVTDNNPLLEEYELNLIYLVAIVLPLVTIVGNWAVLLAVWREKNLQNSTNFLIVSLAVADLLVGLIVMPWGIFALVSPLSKICCNKRQSTKINLG